MPNPWTKKNPLLSMWLSAANATAGAAKGRMASQSRRAAAQASAAATSEYFQQLHRLWLGAPVRKRRSKRR